jgi:hypothetical protein
MTIKKSKILIFIYNWQDGLVRFIWHQYPGQLESYRSVRKQ